MTYDGAAGLRILDVPSSWEVVDNSSGLFDPSSGGDTRNIGWAWMQNQSGTEWVTLRVSEGGAHDLTVQAEAYKAGSTTSTVSFTTATTATQTDGTIEPTTAEQTTDSTTPSTTTEAFGSPSVSVVGGTVAPGESVTVEVNADNVGTLSLAGIPTDWTIESRDAAGGSPVTQTVDGTQKIGWTWSTNQDSVSIAVTLGIPGDAAVGDTTLTAEAGNANNRIETDTATVAVTEPTTTEAFGSPSVSVVGGTV
ncbi:MAG: hypothetical protein ABEJ86_02285, partial [Halococcoides sp.]